MDALRRSTPPRDQNNSETEPANFGMSPDRGETGNHTDREPQEFREVIGRMLGIRAAEHGAKRLSPGIKSESQGKKAAPEIIGFDVAKAMPK